MAGRSDSLCGRKGNLRKSVVTPADLPSLTKSSLPADGDRSEPKFPNPERTAKVSKEIGENAIDVAAVNRSGKENRLKHKCISEGSLGTDGEAQKFHIQESHALLADNSSSYVAGKKLFPAGQLQVDRNHRCQIAGQNEIDMNKRPASDEIEFLEEALQEMGGNGTVSEDNVKKDTCESSVNPKDGNGTNTEIDMLGSVKPMERNEEAAEGQDESKPHAVMTDISSRRSERTKDDVGIVCVENEQQRPLRLGEEAGLGRGKRPRKDVNYVELDSDDDEKTNSDSDKEFNPTEQARKEKLRSMRGRRRFVRAETTVNQVQNDPPPRNVVISLSASSRYQFERQKRMESGQPGRPKMEASLPSSSWKTPLALGEATQHVPSLAISVPEESCQHPLENKNLNGQHLYHPLPRVSLPGGSDRSQSSKALHIGEKQLSVIQNPPSYNQQEKVLPLSGLHQLRAGALSIGDNQHEVVNDTMPRRGSGFKPYDRRNVADIWHEDELDSLWLGVRRHGYGNWGNMLADSSLKFHKLKKPEHLEKKWETERKLMDNRSSLVPGNSVTPMMNPNTTADNLAGDSSSERPKIYPLNSLEMGESSSLDLNRPSLFRSEEDCEAIRRGKRPCVRDTPSPPRHDSRNRQFTGGSANPALSPHPNPSLLPHWLRDAISVGLPPSVSPISTTVPPAMAPPPPYVPFIFSPMPTYLIEIDSRDTSSLSSSLLRPGHY